AQPHLRAPLVPNPQKACCNGPEYSARFNGANEKRGGIRAKMKTARRCPDHIISGGTEAIFTKPIDFLMFGNEIEMRVERAA
ncbi:MAG: hypothetical protein WA723_13120, partial [Pseudolabrys sp.]